MKTSLNLVLAAIFSILFLSCTAISNNIEGVKASKNYITRNYKVNNFDVINATAACDIHFTQSTDGKYSLQVYGPDNYIELMEVFIKGNTLNLEMKKHNKIRNGNKLKITICAPDLKRIDFKGVGNIDIEKGLTTNKLEIESKGVGNIDIQDLKCQDLTVSSMGVGNVKLQGKVTNAHLSSKGVGDIKASDLEAENVTASSNGVGNITCFATKSLDASAKGVGSIDYKGNPSQKTFNKKGVGSIKSI